MTRRSRRREIESTVEDLDADDGDDERSRIRLVYRDPVTGRCFQSRAPDADPVETLPEDAEIVAITRSLGMTREQAEAEGREIIEVIEEHQGGDVVAVRVEPTPDVDVEDAVRLDDERLGTPIDLQGGET